MIRRHLRRATNAALLTLACAGVAACGSSGSGSGDGDTSAGPTRAQTTAAAAAVEKASGPVSFTAPGRAFDVAALRGRTLYFVTVDAAIPFIQAAYQSMKEAGEYAGVQVRMVDAKGQTAAVATGIEQAVAAGAGAIMVGNAAFKYIPEAVRRANEANIPLVGLLNVSAGQELEPGASGEVTLDYRLSGELLVAYAVANTDGPVNAIYAHIPAVDTFVAMQNGVKEGFEKYCDGCDLKVFDLQQSTLKQQMESKTQSLLRGDKSINWVFPAIDVAAQFGVPAVQQAGRGDSVRIGSINAAQPNLGFIQAGQVQAVDVGNSNGWLGYAAVDRLLRAMAGERGESEVPVRLFDRANLEGKDVRDEDQLFPGVDFRDEFRQLWLNALGASK